MRISDWSSDVCSSDLDALRPLQAIRTPAMTKAQHIVTALLLATTACSNASDISGAYERGIAALEAGQPRTARVEFMNAIQADPDTGAARVLQASTYLAMGDLIATPAHIEGARPQTHPARHTRQLLCPARRTGVAYGK